MTNQRDHGDEAPDTDERPPYRPTDVYRCTHRTKTGSAVIRLNASRVCMLCRAVVHILDELLDDNPYAPYDQYAWQGES